MSMITASIWVPRGFAASCPTKYIVDEEELARISNLAKLQLEDAKLDFDAAKNQPQNSLDERENGAHLPRSQKDGDDDLKEYDLEHYDSDIVNENGETLAMFGNARSLAYHESNADDPYITLDDEGEVDEEREELQILKTDNLLVAAKVEDEIAHLEVYVYEDEADNLYVHHDIMLPAIPLCVEWLDLPVGKTVTDLNTRANYVAVGTFDPNIEIWDLDTIDCLYPNAILGQGAEDGNFDEPSKSPLTKKKKRKKSTKANANYHIDAILSLAANKHHRNLLASSSADKTVKLWDLNAIKCAKSYTHHTDKVCSLAWHPKETTVLLSGSYDRTVVAADMRSPDTKVPRWGVESDVETVMWDPYDPNHFYVTTENGVVHHFDARSAPPTPETTISIWKLQAHDQSISSFDVNAAIPGFLVTGSTDKEVKLWNVQSSGPSMVVSRNLGVGRVFTTKFAPDREVAFRLAVAGSKGTVQVWDTSTNAAIRRAFAHRIVNIQDEDGNDVKEKLVCLAEDSSDSEEEGGIEPGGEDKIKKNEWESMDED